MKLKFEFKDTKPRITTHSASSFSFCSSKETITNNEEVTQINTFSNRNYIISNFQLVTSKILLIEDNSKDARLVCVLAQATISQCHLTHVERLSEALHQLKENNFDVDLSLPDEHGLDNGKWHATAPNIPLVVLTTFDNEALVIRCEREGAQDHYHIQNEDISIPEADRTKLFNLFHRTSNIGTVSGTGLGLASVKNVNLHGGKIAVTSKIGIGTTFTAQISLNDRI